MKKSFNIATIETKELKNTIDNQKVYHSLSITQQSQHTLADFANMVP